MANSIHNSLWEWFLQCQSITKLFFNFSGAEDGDTAIVTSGDSVIEEYIDKSQRRQYAFELTRFLPISFEENDSGNVAMMEDTETIVQWVRDQCASGNYPVFPEGCVVEEVIVLDNYTGYVAAQDGNTAKYMIPFAIEYMKG